MSLECGECEHDLRGGHAEDCSRHPINKAGRQRVMAAYSKYRDISRWEDTPDVMTVVALMLIAADGTMKKRWHQWLS